MTPVLLTRNPLTITSKKSTLLCGFEKFYIKFMRRKKRIDMEQRKRYLFTNRDLTRLIAPLIVEQILAVTVGMADTMMVASCGEAAVSGISLVDTISVLLIGMFGAMASGGAVTVAQYIGKKDRAKPGDILGALAGESGIPGKVVGTIDMYDKYTFVEVPAEYAREIINSVNNTKIRGKSVAVEPANQK